MFDLLFVPLGQTFLSDRKGQGEGEAVPNVQDLSKLDSKVPSTLSVGGGGLEMASICI